MVASHPLDTIYVMDGSKVSVISGVIFNCKADMSLMISSVPIIAGAMKDLVLKERSKAR